MFAGCGCGCCQSHTCSGRVQSQTSVCHSGCPQMPKVQYRSNCKPSTFAYPPALEVPKEKEKEKVRTEWQKNLRGNTFVFSMLLAEEKD